MLGRGGLGGAGFGRARVVGRRTVRARMAVWTACILGSYVDVEFEGVRREVRGESQREIVLLEGL